MKPRSMRIEKAKTENIEEEPPNEMSEEFAGAEPDPPEEGNDKKPKKGLRIKRLLLFCEIEAL